MHGQNLDKALFGIAEPKQLQQETKGRSKHFMEKRNMAIYCRYYAYSVVTSKMAYDAKIYALSQEFFLSTAMIIKILSAGADHILKIKREKLTVKEMKEMFPFYNWQLKMD